MNNRNPSWLNYLKEDFLWKDVKKLSKSTGVCKMRPVDEKGLSSGSTSLGNRNAGNRRKWSGSHGQVGRSPLVFVSSFCSNSRSSGASKVILARPPGPPLTQGLWARDELQPYRAVFSSWWSQQEVRLPQGEGSGCQMPIGVNYIFFINRKAKAQEFFFLSYLHHTSKSDLNLDLLLPNFTSFPL